MPAKSRTAITQSRTAITHRMDDEIHRHVAHKLLDDGESFQALYDRAVEMYLAGKLNLKKSENEDI